MKIIFLFNLLLVANLLHAQSGVQLRGEQPIHTSLTIDGIATSNNTVPFWMRTNQYGSIPLDGLSASVLAAFYCDYHEIDSGKKWYENKWDCAVGVQGKVKAGYEMQFQLIEDYLKVKYSIFQAKIGRIKYII